MKHITIINSSKKESPLYTFISKLNKELESKNIEVSLFNLEEMSIQHCIGCWYCWWKTPGYCIHKDDGEHIFRAVINSDLTILASPIIVGFTNALLKRITDRLIVLLHPYIKIIEKECHHKKRYPKYPKFGLLLEKEADTDNEDLEIIKSIYERFTINFHSSIDFIKCIDNINSKDIINETINY